MKNIILLLFILVSANAFSQNRVTLKFERTRIDIAMKTISKQTGIEFAYNPKAISTKHIVSVNIIDENIDRAIAILFADIYSYTKKGKYIIITSEKETTDNQNDNNLLVDEIRKNNKLDSGTTVDSCLSIRKERKPIIKRLGLKETPLITNNKKDTTMLKKAASLIALSALTLMPTMAQTNEPIAMKPIKEELNPQLQKSLAHVSFAYPLSTDGANAKDKEYKFSLNILGGITGGINGAEIGGLFNINKHNVRGVQVAGLFNLTEGINKGLQLGGLFNSAKISKGVQVGGVFNLAQETSSIQIGGLMNQTKESSNVQIAGVMNIASNAGTQISVLNIAKKSGFQMGVVNISESDESTMLGLFNYVKKGGLFEVGISSNDYIYGAANLVTGTDRLYSILSMGVHSSTISIGAGVGTRIQMGSSPSGIHLELMHNQLYKNDFKNMETNATLNQFRALYSQRKNKFTFYAGPTFNVLLRDVEFEKAKKPIYSIFNNKGKNHNLDSWIGAEIGIRYNLR